MEIRACFYCVIINCAVIIPCLAKPISLNELIAKEAGNESSQLKKTTSSDPVENIVKKHFVTSKPPLKRRLAEPEHVENVASKNFVASKPPLKRKLAQKEIFGHRISKSFETSNPPLRRRLLRPDSTFATKISSIQYRKAFQIKSPLRPKRITHLQRPRNKRKNQARKRDTQHYGPIKEKYIPLLRNLGLLFDDILGADSGESNQENRQKYKDYSYVDETDEVICTCASKKDSIRRTSNTPKKTTLSAGIVTTEITTEPTKVATETALNTTTDNLSTLRWNKNIPLLFTRNTTSFRGNNNRLNERSGSSHLGSVERHITGDCGNNECDSRDREIKSDTKNNEEDTYGVTRDYASSDRPDDGRGGNGDIKDNGKTKISIEFISATNKTTKSSTRHLSEHEGEIQFEVRRDEAQSTGALPKPNSRLRNFESYEYGQLSQTTEDYEESEFEEPPSDTAYKRFFERNGENTAENQTLRGTDEAVITANITYNPTSQDEKLVMIYDGYSIARDVNDIQKQGKIHHMKCNQQNEIIKEPLINEK